MVSNKEVSLVIEGKPQGKERPRMTKRGVVYTPKKTRDYEKTVGETFTYSNKEMLSGEIEAEITAVFEIPKNTPRYIKKRMLEGEERPQKKPDLDNIIKSVLDSLNKKAYEDDKQIVKVTAEKVYGEKGKVIVKLKERKRELE